MTIISTQRSEGHVVAEKQTVEIGIAELISMMAEKVAQTVVDELREQDIKPLVARVQALEIRQVVPNPEIIKVSNTTLRFQSMFEGAWKLALIALTLLEAWSYLHGTH